MKVNFKLLLLGLILSSKTANSAEIGGLLTYNHIWASASNIFLTESPNAGDMEWLHVLKGNNRISDQTSFSIGGQYKFDMSNANFRINLSYDYMNFSFNQLNAQTPSRNVETGELTTGDAQVDFNFAINSLGLEFINDYYLFDKLYLSFGFGTAYYNSNSVAIFRLKEVEANQDLEYYNEAEKTGTLRNNNRTRELTIEELGEQSINKLHFYGILHLGYEYKYSKFFAINPFIQINFGLSNIAPNANWQLSQFRSGIAFRYIFQE